MSKNFLRVVAFLMLSVMLLSMLVACGGKDTEDEAQASDNVSTVTDDVLDPDADGLPEKDFGGADFAVLSTAEREYYILPDKIANDSIKKAVYARNLAVEERFNVKIDINEQATSTAALEYVTAAMGSGEVGFDMISYHYVGASAIAINGYAKNLCELPYLDFSRDWWSDSTADDLTINGKCYIAYGDFAVTAISGTFCMFYDREKLADWTDVNLDEVVSKGGWTYEYMYNLIYNINEPNSDDVRDDKDFYGMATGRVSAIDAYMWAFNNPVYTKNSAGELECNYYSARITDIFDKLYSLCYENPGMYYGKGHNEGREMFVSGNAIMGNAVFEDAIQHFADVKNTYGIIPYPKLDSNQERYYSMVEGGSASIMAPITLEGETAERAGIIIEALCAESHKKLLPEFYDVVLKTRYSSSPVDAEMVDILVASRIFDFGFVYDNWKGCGFWAERIIATEGKSNITSVYENNFGPVKEHYEGILKDLFDYDVSKIRYSTGG